MGNIAETIREDLKRHDWDEPIFKALVAEPGGVPEITIDRPTEYNQGAIASVLEYTRQLAICLLEELKIAGSSEKWLNFTLEKFLGINRYPGETDLDWFNRVKNVMFGIKSTCNALIDALLNYSSPGEPKCESGQTSVMYSDVSFSDVYSEFQNTTPGMEFGYWVFPAITANGVGISFYFRIILQNTPVSELPQVVDIINRLKAAGTAYDVIVETV